MRTLLTMSPSGGMPRERVYSPCKRVYIGLSALGRAALVHGSPSEMSFLNIVYHKPPLMSTAAAGGHILWQNVRLFKKAPVLCDFFAHNVVDKLCADMLQ